MHTHYGWMHEGSLARSTYECDQCGDEYNQYDYRNEKKEREFCSDGCYRNWRSENIVGENHPLWSGGDVEIECRVCGETVYRRRAYVDNRENQFCGYECYGKWRSENITGESHPRYKPDKEDISYGQNWHRQRERCLGRDGYECRTCEMSREQHLEKYEKDLNVHHIKKLRSFDTGDGINYEAANSLSNLITLCYSCHQMWEDMDIRPQIG